MSGVRWDRLQDLFHQALLLGPGQRAVLLERECQDDESLRTEVERLLAAADGAAGFIDQPAIAQAGTEPESDPIDRRVGSYRLMRELGRGGMGAVYLAERDDGAFTQRVAIKLIKRGMDTDQVLARFRAERQILASLDHPNIARLLDGGTTDDGLPYFAMEYIEGQPIDAYSGEKRLTVDQRLVLFLQVCDAVAYAHAHGVVHRDIKPLNTLVTPAGVPKLLDFGIAKVLQDNPDESAITVTGLRLLTPDYASPEQIEGRPATGASDVYSLGVVLYELLTGCSPYPLTSRSPQEVIAAVCTTEPDRPSTVVTYSGKSTGRPRRAGPPTGPGSSVSNARQLSRRLRGDLDTIVLTALRKEPDRRYASVASLADDIRRHLDGRPVLARADKLGYRAGKFARRHRTALLTAVLAVVSAGVLAMIGFALARSGDGTEGATLFANAALAPRDRILVADFVDRTGDTTLTAAVTEALRIDLGQSPVVRVLTPRQVLASLVMMERSPDIALDDSLARELAVREGVKAIVTGTLARLAGSYTINVQLVAAQSGEALAAVRETAADSSQLIAAVDRASKTLRRRIGESLRELEGMPSLERATTASLPALRLYTEGQRLFRRGQRQSAIDRLEEAVALDSGFASAFVTLAMAHGSVGDVGRSMAYRDRAFANQARLTFLERSFLVASTAYGNEDYPTAIRIYSEVMERFPDNLPAINNLALAYRESRQYARSESLFRRAADADSAIANFYFGLHGTQALQGEFARARATLDTIARRFPDDPILLTEELQDAAAQRDWPRAERVAWSHIEKAGADTLQLVDPYEALAGIAQTRGRLKESERLWQHHSGLTGGGVNGSRHLFGVLQLGYLHLGYRGDTTGAVALVDSALRAIPLDSLLPGDRRYYDVARFFLAAGLPGRVRPLLADAAVTDSMLGRESRADRTWTLSLLAGTEGKGAGMLDALRQAAETHICNICVLPDLGRAYEAAGRLRDAAATYERYLTTPWLWRYEPDAVELGWTLRRLGDVAERLGDLDRARAARQQLLELWDRADPALHPVLDSVRAQLRQ